MARQVIRRIHKNESEEIHISKVSYRGTAFVDLRIFWKPTEREALPTRKGFLVPIKLVKEVINGMKEALSNLGKI